MTGGGILGAAMAGLSLALAAFALGWAISSGWSRPKTRGDPKADLLSDGAVLLIADGMIRQESPCAAAILGSVLGHRIADVLDHLLGPQAQQAIDAVTRLEEKGNGFALLLRAKTGSAYELIGTPSGALIRLIIRDASHVDRHLADAEARLAAADMALQKKGLEQGTLQTLIARAPIIVWHRDVSGTINWSAGQIETGAGIATHVQVTDMIAARTRMDRQPATPGEPEKSRIEIVVGDSAETISVHIVEIMREDGSRIGFGTDAGSATLAERTLTRFVQTMTETFAHLTVGLAIFDRNQTLALFNPALVEMWNLEPTWLAHRPSLRDILDELRALRRLPEPENFHSWRDMLLNLFENTEAADYEELWHLADGSNIRVLARPHPHGAIAFTFDDVTERMQLEQRYRHSIDLRRATIDDLSEGIVVFGPDGLVQFANQTFHQIWGTKDRTIERQSSESGPSDAAMHARQLIEHCEKFAPAPDTWQKLHGFITGEENRGRWSARLETACGRALDARFAPMPDGSTLAIFHDISVTEQISEDLRNSRTAIEIAETARATLHRLIGALGRKLSEQAAQNAASGTEGAAGRGKLQAGNSSQPGQGMQGSEMKAAQAPDDAAKAISAGSAPIGQLLARAEAIAAQSLQPLLHQQKADLAAIFDLVAMILEPQMAEKGLTILVDNPAPALVRSPSAQLARITQLLVEKAIGCAGPGATIRLHGARLDGADGAADFMLGVEVSAAIAAPAREKHPKGRREHLRELVVSQGGRILCGEMRQGEPLSLRCYFGSAAMGKGMVEHRALPRNPTAGAEL